MSIKISKIKNMQNKKREIPIFIVLPIYWGRISHHPLYALFQDTYGSRPNSVCQETQKCIKFSTIFGTCKKCDDSGIDFFTISIVPF